MSRSSAARHHAVVEREEAPESPALALLWQAEEAGVRLTPAMAEGVADGHPRMMAYVANLVALRGHAPVIQPRLDGGPVRPGQMYTGNEEGPEGVVTGDGSVHPLGNGRPVAFTASQPATVVPHADYVRMAGDNVPHPPLKAAATPPGSNDGTRDFSQFGREWAQAQPASPQAARPPLAGASSPAAASAPPEVPSPPPAKPAPPRPYSQATVAKLQQMMPHIQDSARLWGVDPREMMFSIGEEYETRHGPKSAFDGLQDWMARKGMHFGLPGNKLADIGPANFAVHNGSALLDYYNKRKDERLILRGSSPDIPDGNIATWLESDKGTAYASAMHLRRYHDRLDRMVQEPLTDEQRHRLAVMYFRQGDNFLKRYACQVVEANKELQVDREVKDPKTGRVTGYQRQPVSPEYVLEDVLEQRAANPALKTHTPRIPQATHDSYIDGYADKIVQLEKLIEDARRTTAPGRP